jgi:MoxR-like ATPase
MQYTKLFEPPMAQDLRTKEERCTLGPGDRRDGKVYRYTDQIVLAVNVALATGRPLLLTGPSGSGKSSLAFSVARSLMRPRRYYEFVITSRTQARDLLWRFDAIRRLGDAQAAAASNANRNGQAAAPGAAEEPGAGADAWRSYYPYIEPGVLWWAFDRGTARRRGAPDAFPLPHEARDPVTWEPDSPNGQAASVILLDEIDKADPDFPNSLLVPLGSLEFEVEEIGRKVTFGGDAASAPSPDDLPLLIITTNNERRLPDAFLRRCITLTMPQPSTDDLVAIAKMVQGTDNAELYKALAAQMETMVAQLAQGGARRPELSIAEYLDAVRAVLRLKDQSPDPALVEAVLRMTLTTSTTAE